MHYSKVSGRLQLESSTRGVVCESPSGGVGALAVGAGVPTASAPTVSGEGSETGPLGIHARNASPPLPEAAFVRRFLLQRLAGELVPRERVRGCLRWLQGGRDGVQLLHVPKHRTGALKGLQTCGSVWSCPVCATKISERRRLELGAAVRAWEEKSGLVLLVTYTICHKLADSLKQSLAGLLDARRRLLNGKAAKGFNARFGVAGRIRAVEVTHGKNGWHPHVHELVFVPRGIDLVGFLATLRTRWSACVQRAGLRDVNSHGIDVRFADMTVADYVAKFGRERTWDKEHELAKQVTKQGKNGSLSPIGLLMAYAQGDEPAGKRWAEYALTLKGCRQLAWSDGLRSLLGLDPEQSDAQIAEQVRDEAVLMGLLNSEQWKCVVGNDVRAELLQVLGRGSVAELREFLVALGVEVEHGERDSEHLPHHAADELCGTGVL